MAKKSTTTAISNRMPSIQIEYTSRNSRITKEFTGDQIAKARHLFAQKMNAGKEPRVVAGNLDVATLPQPAVEENPAAALAATVAAKAQSHASPATIALPARTRLTRPEACGVVLKRHGLDAKITPELVAEVDALYGAANDRETRFAFANARNAVKGFLAK